MNFFTWYVALGLFVFCFPFSLAGAKCKRDGEQLYATIFAWPELILLVSAMVAFGGQILRWIVG